MWRVGKFARLRREFAKAATACIEPFLPQVSVSATRGAFRLEGASVDCDLETWFAKWVKVKETGVNAEMILVELTTSLKQALRKPAQDAAPIELDAPEEATITKFNEFDRIGRLTLESGEELRFGGTACQGFEPSLGARVFVTKVGTHPLGGRKAITVRAVAKTEAEVRAEAAATAAAEAAEAERDRAERREKALATTTHEAIVSRVKDSVMPEEDNDADEHKLYELVDDLELMEPSLTHVNAIVQGIAESPAMAHFGAPGPLVHYVETFSEKGYEEALFEVSRTHPTSHFVWMLARLNHPDFPQAAEARAILHSYLEHPQSPPPLREKVADYLS